jgi:hypothetical protein
VVGRVPVLCEDDVLEACGQTVDHGNDCIAVGNGKSASEAEVALEIDEQEQVI